MKNNIVQFAFIVVAIVLGGALEDMLPSIGSLGFPILLSLAVFFAVETRTPVWIMAAVAAGAFEEAIGSLPQCLSAAARGRAERSGSTGAFLPVCEKGR